VSESVKLYRYRWDRSFGMPSLEGKRKGELCEVLMRLKRNNAVVQFQDGFTAIVSRNALKKAGATATDSR
jgi:hypothetical protein